MVRGGAVPVLLVGVGVDDVAGTDVEDGLAAGLDEPDALGDVERLAHGVRMPGRAGTGGEMDRVHPHPRRLLAADDGVEVHVTGEPFGRALPGRLLRYEFHDASTCLISSSTSRSSLWRLGRPRPLA